MPLQRLAEGALALLHLSVDEQPEDRSDEEDGHEDEGEHGDDPPKASRAARRVSSEVAKSRR
jgi:hypothetical protein